MKLQPIHDRIIAKRVKLGEMTKGGILLPDPEMADECEVIAVGPGKPNDIGTTHVPVAVSVGDKILIGKYSGATVKVDGEELLVLREEDVFAVVRA